jgi:hypothetical protein
MSKTDLVTIEGTMQATDVVKYFEHPDNFTFKWSEDPEEMRKRIEADTMAAETPEQLFGGESEVLKAADWIGRPLQFRTVKWVPSDVEGAGLPFYGLFTVALPNGEIRLLSCGARNVVLRAAKAAVHGWFPRWLKIVEVQVKNPVKGHKPPLDLISAPDPTPDTSTDGEPF